MSRKRARVPPLLQRFAEEGFSHHGVIFVDRSAIPSNDFGRLVRAIIQYWDQERDAEWRDRIVFLPAPAKE